MYNDERKNIKGRSNAERIMVCTGQEVEEEVEEDEEVEGEEEKQV